MSGLPATLAELEPCLPISLNTHFSEACEAEGWALFEYTVAPRAGAGFLAFGPQYENGRSFMGGCRAARVRFGLQLEWPLCSDGGVLLRWCLPP